jgi:hypothetical protein
MDDVRSRILPVAAGALAILIAGCGGGSGGGSGTGLISLAVSDGPIHEAEKVCIEFDQIEFKGDGGRFTEMLDPPAKIDLLYYRGMNAAPLLEGLEIPAGNYQWMRLGVNAVLGTPGGVGDIDSGVEGECDGEGSYIILPSGMYNLYVPSSAQTGLKLVGGFIIPNGGSADFTAEFDLMKSVTAPNGLSPDVILKPAIRLVNNAEVGTLAGMVSDGLAAPEPPAECAAPSVYVFDQGVTPNPIDESDDDPIATAMVGPGDQGYEYTVGFLLEGIYSVAFTCDGETFEPGAGEEATINVNDTTYVDFPVPEEV